jgi:putative membrane protein
MRNAIVIGTVVLAMSVVPAFAGSAKGSKGAKRSAKAISDQTFVVDAARGNLAEIELGKLAAEKASSEDVKKFGQHMVDDHSKALEELKKIASQKNIQLPSDIDPKEKALRDRLSKLSGPAFDRTYMQAMLRDHRQVVNEFKREATSGKDPDVKTFASTTLPTIEEHLKAAQSTTRAVGTSGTLDKSTGSKKPQSGARRN